MSDLRDAIREQIVNSPKGKPASKIVTFLGADIELRSPTLASILEQPQSESEGRTAVVKQLIDNAYVPGTDELIFEESDMEMLLGLAYSDDLAKVFTTMTEFITPNSKAPLEG
jgi:hypothetical protein